MCAIHSTFFPISLQQNDILGGLAVYFLLLLLYGKTLSIYMLITAFLKPKVLTLVDLENLTSICSIIYLFLSICFTPIYKFLHLKDPLSKVYPN